MSELHVFILAALCLICGGFGGAAVAYLDCAGRLRRDRERGRIAYRADVDRKFAKLKF